jgi:hypothetical protein
MEQVNSLLGGLKNLITTAQAKMIFIAGREMYDAYLSERGNTSSLYESLFDTYIYIPSLLTDHSDGNMTVLDSMVETYVCSKILKKDWIDDLNKDSKIKIVSKNADDLIINSGEIKDKYDLAYVIKVFVHFITLHSWGNIKRMSTLFETFVVSNSSKDSGSHKYEIVFSIQDLQRIVFASQLYIPFHQGLSRTMAHSDDKLVVSSFAVFHYLLKFHNMSFSKSSVNRMYEALNIHSSTELSSIVDTIIDKVLRSQIRRIRNSMYRYRFSSVVDQEIHYITSIKDYESAAFSFSLNAIKNVKNHYLSMLIEQLDYPDNSNIEQIAELYLIIGGFNFWEQSHDEANLYFGYAEKVLYRELIAREGYSVSGNYSALVLYIESLLKRASVAERNSNYTLAASIYHDAYMFVKENSAFNSLLKDKSVDSKWDILRQPYWALLYLNLKRSPSKHRRKDNLEKYPLEESYSDVYHYQLGTYFSFINNYQASLSEYLKVIEETKVLSISRERSAFLGGNALIKAGMSLVTGIVATLQKKLYLDKSSEVDQKIGEFHSYIQAFSNGSNSNNISSLHQLSLLTTKPHFKGGKEYRRLRNRNLNKKIEIENDKTGNYTSSVGLCDVLGLVLEGAEALEKRQLHSLAAQGYLTITMLINLFQEMFPRREIEANGIKNSSPFSHDNFKKLIDESLDRAFSCQGISTGKAFSHSMKTLWKDNINENVSEYIPINLEYLRNNNKTIDKEYKLMNWHYSAFGQLTLAIFYWTDLTWCIINPCLSLNNAAIKNVDFDKIPPFGERFYAIMLWTMGRYKLYEVIESIGKLDDYSESAQKIIMECALESAVYLYRSSQYISQISSDEQNIIFPPKFLINYHQWELIHALEELFISQRMNTSVRDEMTNILRSSSYEDITDISTRVFDYDLLRTQALDALKTVENMGDINSKARREVFANKYYLDDDYEDLVFTLDWTYSHSMGATALICQEIIKRDSKIVSS